MLIVIKNFFDHFNKKINIILGVSFDEAVDKLESFEKGETVEFEIGKLIVIVKFRFKFLKL